MEKKNLMEVILILLPLALGIALFFLIAFIWAVRSGQFDDTTTPAYRILIEDAPLSETSTQNLKKPSFDKVDERG